jgi:hypothetical protein
MSMSELAVASQKMSVAPCDIALKRIAGIDYLSFAAEAELPINDIEILSGLSFTFALFELVAIGGADCLRPVDKIVSRHLDEGLSSILKYTGKTNEIFTRMMLNVAYYSQDKTGGIRLLDPVAGKGTTLYEGLIKGFDAYGVEIGDKIVAEAYQFMKKYLETEKYKHESEKIRVSGPNKSFVSTKYVIDFAKTKEAFKEKDKTHFEMIAGNSARADFYYKKNFFDIIAGDLPYGVQHGSVTSQKQSSLTRNPAELLESCMPAWVSVLRPGGVIALAWNTYVLSRENIERIFERNGLSVKNDAAYLGFSHRVDQSIIRDVIVAIKPSAKHE